MNIKILSTFLILVMVINLILFAFGKMNELLFWGIIVVIALFAYKILPKLKK